MSPECTEAADYSIQIWDTVSEIDAPAWESLRNPDDLFMDLRMLWVTAGTMSDTDSFSFLLVRDADGRPVAATCLWRVTIEGTLLAQDNWLIRSIKRLASIVPTLNHHRILVCGMPVSAGQNNLRFAPGADQSRILAALNGKLEAIARSERLRCIVFKEFEDLDSGFTATFERLGSRRADSLPMNQFEPACNSLADYLASSNSKKRSQIRNSYKKLQGGDLRLHVTSDPDEVCELYSDRVHQLYHAVLGRAEARLETLPACFFRELSRQFADATSFCFIMNRDTVCAFGVVLFSQRVAYPLYVGVDYELNAEHELYFNTMYAMLDESLRRGVELISWGQTADQFKQMKLSCYQTPRCFFLKGTNRLMDAVIDFLFPQLFPDRVIAEQAVRRLAAQRVA